MAHERKLTLTVKKNSRKGGGTLRPSQKLKSDMESDCTYIANSGSVISVETGRANQLHIFYTPSLLTSDEHKDIESDDDFLQHINDKYQIKFTVNYAGINRDNPAIVLLSYDQNELDKIKLADSVTGLKRERSQLERKQNENSKSDTKLKSAIQEIDELVNTNQTLLQSLQEAEQERVELLSESIELESDSKLYSNNPAELLNFINEETKKKFVEDHSDYSKHADELGTDGVLEYIVNLVESSNYFDTNEVSFTASIIEKEDKGEIFDDSGVLEDIVMYYTMEKRENKLDQLSDSIRKSEAKLYNDTQDDPQDVTDARAFVEMYELWDEGTILKEQSLPAYKSSLRTIKNCDSKKSMANKALARKKGTVKLMENFSKELDKSKIKWSDIERLTQEGAERSEKGGEFLYFGLRTEDKSEVSMPIEPIPAEVAESMGYFIERIHILPSERIRE